MMNNMDGTNSPKMGSFTQVPTRFKYTDGTSSPKKGSFTHVPTRFKNTESIAVGCFDTKPDPVADVTISKESENSSNTQSVPSPNSVVKTNDFYRSHSISVSMPTWLSDLNVEHTEGVLPNQEKALDATHGHSDYPVDNLRQPKQAKYYSQPILTGKLVAGSTTLEGKDPGLADIRRKNRLMEKQFDSFRTWSGKLERQTTNLHGKPVDTEDSDDSQVFEPEAVPGADRYFDALEGPELEVLKASEELILPEDMKWPFLLRFPISSFAMCLGTASQAMLWKTLATSASTRFLHISPIVNLVLWCISLAVTATVSLIYVLKIIFYFEAVRREYYHPIRVNFFFAPWIAYLFLLIGLPPLVAHNLPSGLWYVLMSPILCLELKLYGQWMSGGQRRLSKVANPSNHLSIVGNFVGALLGAEMGLKEGPIFFFAVGLAHYAVLFVTLYQRLPTNESLPKELHPVFFLFIAAPSMASMSWEKITGDFGYGSRIAFFVALFLYASLVVRVNFFRGFRFSLAWWAYTFPMAGISIASINYASEFTNISTKALSVALACISVLTVATLFGTTLFHAFVLCDLFPNDISIAITEKKSKSCRKRMHYSAPSLVANDVESCIPDQLKSHSSIAA